MPELNISDNRRDLAKRAARDELRRVALLINIDDLEGMWTVEDIRRYSKTLKRAAAIIERYDLDITGE